MTDGHIFFDSELLSQGKRPAVNPFLSVTRVGHQTQTHLQKDLSRELSEFLVTYEQMKQFMHFGAEIGGTTKKILNLGAKLDEFFNQSRNKAVAINVNMLVIAGLWAGIWNEAKIEEFKKELEQLVLLYETDSNYQKKVDELMESYKKFPDLVTNMRRDNKLISSIIGRSVS
jgi:F0F1-type ATP synthase alpha subunit